MAGAAIERPKDPSVVYLMFRPILEMEQEVEQEQPWWWRYWRKNWCDPEFGHVVIVKWDNVHNAWAVLDYAFGGIHLLGYEEEFTLEQLAFNFYASRVFEIIVPEHPTRFRPVGIISCVSLAKGVLGMRGWRSSFVITPKQLWDYLHSQRKDRGHGRS